MILAERMKIVNGFVPQSANGGLTADYVSMKNYNHATIIITCGAMPATCNITVNRATAVAATGATTYSFDRYWINANVNGYHDEDATSTDTLTSTTGASGTIATGATANQMIIIEIDAEQIRSGGTTAYDCIAAVVSDPSAADYMSCVYIMSGARYAQDTPPTAITD